jgi:hypothetical protein
MCFMKPGRVRKKIAYQKKGSPAIEDELAFVSNKCSVKARKIDLVVENIQIELWFDKHYFNRYYLGDENGKREGIDPKAVGALVKKSFPFLLLYSCEVRGFAFVNYFDSGEPGIRVVLQQALEDRILNVVIETHYKGVNQFEMTVKTAMCCADFRISIGQYVIDFHGNVPVLKKK